MMVICRQSLAAARALEDSITNVTADRITPYALHGCAGRAFELPDTDGSNSRPFVTATDAKCFTGKVWFVTFWFCERNDLCAH